MTVPAFRVVEQLDVIEHIRTSLGPGQVDPALDPFALEQLKAAFHHCVVVAVTTPAHAGLESMGFQEVLPVVAAELATLVGMYQYLLHGLSAPDSHQQSTSSRHLRRVGW